MIPVAGPPSVEADGVTAGEGSADILEAAATYLVGQIAESLHGDTVAAFRMSSYRWGIVVDDCR